MAKIKVVVMQGYNNIELIFPDCCFAGVFMNTTVKAAEGNVSFKVIPVEEEDKAEQTESEDE